jgi:hypothetical protein
MSDKGNTTVESLKSISMKIDLLLEKMEKVASQVESMYYDEEPPEENRRVTAAPLTEKPSANYIKQYGVRISYNLIDDPADVAEFKEFIYQAKANFRYLTTDELKWIDVADKDFPDIRLSRKHLTILQDIYPKIMLKPWPFRIKLGYMYKIGDRNKGEMEHIVWDWFS